MQPLFIEEWETMRETKISFPADNINAKLREKDFSTCSLG